jgi:diamine N-acetyltransferase
MKKEKNFFSCIVVENEKKEIVGMAIYSFTYYSWVGKSLYLDDLYVKEKYRNNKIGTKILKRIFQIAQKSHCNRLRWQVGDWNKQAIKFYQRLGADIDRKTFNCDFENKGIEIFLKKD